MMALRNRLRSETSVSCSTDRSRDIGNVGRHERKHAGRHERQEACRKGRQQRDRLHDRSWLRGPHQRLDQSTALRSIPVASAEYAIADDSLSIDQKRHGQGTRPIPQADSKISVMENGKCKTDFLLKRPRDRHALRIGRHSQNLKISAPERPVQLFHRRHLDPAGPAPGRPKIQQDHLSPVLVERDLKAFQILEQKIGRFVPDLDDPPSAINVDEDGARSGNSPAAPASPVARMQHHVKSPGMIQPRRITMSHSVGSAGSED